MKSTKHFKSVCVDLDGVLAKYDGWCGVHHIGEPIPGAKEFLKKLYKISNVIIFSARCGSHNEPDVEEATNIIRKWLDKHEFSYDEIYVRKGKPLASAYVDDRAVVCRPQLNMCVYNEAIDKVLELIIK